MFSKLPLKLIRECEVVQVPDQVDEDASITHSDYESIKDTIVPLPDWAKPKITDLDTLSMPVLTFMRSWVEGYVHRLKRRSIALSYNLMGDQRPPMSAKKRKQIAQPTKPRVQELVHPEPQRTEEASPTQLLARSSSVQEVSVFAYQRARMAEEQNMEEVNQPLSRKLDSQRANAPEGVDQPDEGEETETNIRFDRALEAAFEEEDIAEPDIRGFEEDSQRMETDEPRPNVAQEEVHEVEATEEQPLIVYGTQQNAPNWLTRAIRRDQEDDTNPAIEMEELLNRTSGSPKRKRARKYSRMETDEVGSCTLHVAVPREEYDLGDVMLENYTVTTIELGRPSGAQVVEEAENSFHALKDRLVQKEKKY